MNVLVDGRTLSVEGADTVSEALAAAAAQTDRAGRLIVEVNVDGVIWNEQRIDEEMTRGSRAEDIRLTTCPAAEVVSRAFRDAAEALVEADGRQRDAADHLQAGHQADAMNELDGAIRIWHEVRAALEMGLHVGAALLAPMPDLEQRLSGAVDRLNGQLTAIRDALQCDDPVAVSDALLYDLPDVVHEWRSLLHDLQINLTDPVR